MSSGACKTEPVRHIERDTAQGLHFCMRPEIQGPIRAEARLQFDLKFIYAWQVAKKKFLGPF